MAKESSFVLRICDKITNYSIYAAIFFLPIFFLPWTSDILDFNKQALLITLSFIALFFWMIKALVSGKIEIKESRIHAVVGFLFAVYFFASLFSINKYGSFWGWPQPSSESLLSLIGLVIFYFLISNSFSKKNVLNASVIFFVSAFIAELIGAFQLSGLFIPFSFAKSASFNTIGSVGSLGFFTAILLPLTIAMLIISKKWWKVFFSAQLILSALLLVLIGYPIIWWAVLLGSIFVMVFGIIKRDVFDERWMALPMFFLAISLFFLLMNPKIPFVSQKTNEIFLSYQAGLNISLKAIKESPVLGSGPGTFSYDFLKFKDASLSQSSLWSVVFNQATSKVLNDLSVAGILGLIALLAFIIAPIFYGLKFLLSRNSMEEDEQQKEAIRKNWVLTLGIFCALSVQAVVCFLYNFNITLSFLNFFMLAGLVVLISAKKKEYELKPSSFLTLTVASIITLIFIFGIGILFLGGQRYIAEVNYYKGLASWQAGNKDLGTKSLETAARLNPSSDLYFRQLSQAYLANLQDALKESKTVFSDQEKKKIQSMIANSVNASKIATDLNPKSASNWSNRGYVFQSLFGFIGDSLIWAINCYDEALKLDPNNPYLLSQEGAISLVSAQSLGQDKADQKSKLLDQAKSKLEKAVSLNQNYSNGLYYLGLVYDALGQKDKAIEEFTKLQKLNPKDQDISKILANLKIGLPALQNQTPSPAPLPAENPSPNTPATNKK